MKDIDKHEPPPTGDHDRPFEQSVQHALCETINDTYGIGPIATDLKRAIVLRAEAGKKEYGTYLFPDNGRDAQKDAAQELLDACVYLQQLCMETADESSRALLDEALTLAEKVLRRPLQNLYVSQSPNITFKVKTDKERGYPPKQKEPKL